VINEILGAVACGMGWHVWTYQHPKTGLYLNTYLGQEEIQPPICSGGRWRKCAVCGLKENVK